MNNEEYNKILQLVKSDCPNNRLLGFQLAKGLSYDLMKLLDEIFIKLERDFIVIGDYEMDIYNMSSGGDNNSFVKIYKIFNNQVIPKLVYFEECIHNEFFNIKRDKCMKHFINLIINE